MTRQFHKDGTLPMNGEVWVFGSNLAGIHGAGAARVARECYGAEYGVGFGVTGNTYAIPTKDRNIETMPLEDIEPYVALFVRHATEHQETQFFVTRIGCGLAGYRDEQIAPMFKGAPDNCNLPEKWREYVEA